MSSAVSNNRLPIKASTKMARSAMVVAPKAPPLTALMPIILLLFWKKVVSATSAMMAPTAPFTRIGSSLVKIPLLAVFCLLYPKLLSAQDEFVRIKSGAVLVGQIVQKDDNGFTIEKWDETGSVFIKWSLVSPFDRQRILQLPVTTPEPPKDLIKSIRVFTAYRMVQGKLVNETEEILSIKTKQSPYPSNVAKVAIILRQDIELPEDEIYSPEERVQLREDQIDKNDHKQYLEVARFAESLGLLDHTKRLYAEAIKVLEQKTFTGLSDEEVTKLEEERQAQIEQIQNLIKEIDALVKYKEIMDLVQKNKFDDALEQAATFFEEFGDLKIAKENEDLIQLIEAKKKEYLVNRARVLSEKTVKEYLSLLQKNISQFARLNKLDEAMQKIEDLDEELIQQVIQKYDCSVDEFQEWWEKRQRIRKTVDFSTGSWVTLGGQDGGEDFTETSETQQSNAVEEFAQSFEGRSKVTIPKRKLQTKQQWWEEAPIYRRQRWLKAYHASITEMFEHEEKKSKCTSCKGYGTLRFSYWGKIVDRICPRCHGAKWDLEIIYY